MNARVNPEKTETAEVVTLPVEQAAAPAKKKRSGKRLLTMVSVPLLLVVVGGYFWLNGGRFVDTDNAYVHQAKVSLSADIAGRIVSVSVADNQVVAAGDELFRIDDEPYRIANDQAEAALAAARVGVEQLRVSVDTAKAKLAAAQATLDIRQRELDRLQNLTGQGIAAESTLDDVRVAFQAAQTSVSLAQQEVAAATAALGGDVTIATDDAPAVRTALAALEAAQRNLAKTTVVAPAAGIISQVASLNVGQFVSTGSTIATLVETGNTWIEANFKETQLSGLTDGMPAEVSVDAFPGVKFEGHIASIGAATGSEFALIPAQNASGNWIKVTQRIPVHIVIDGEGSEILRAGMSAVVAIDTGYTTLDLMTKTHS